MKNQELEKLTKQELLALVIDQSEHIEMLEEDWKDMYDDYMKHLSVKNKETTTVSLSSLKDDLIAVLHKDIGSIHKRFNKLGNIELEELFGTEVKHAA